jgi:hypothetical protein
MPVAEFVDLMPDLLPDLVPVVVFDSEGAFALVRYLPAAEDYLFEQSTDCAL